MLFSSIAFLYFFLPLVLGIYYLVPAKAKNAVLLAASMLFYFLGEPVYSILMVVSSLSAYLHGLWIHQAKRSGKAKLPLLLAIFTSLSFLLFFKYADFLIANINGVFQTSLPMLHMPLPIGISFYTFQVLSYVLDVYRGKADVQRNPLLLAMYVSLFPQLIAGPIVRYTTVEKELRERSHTLDNLAFGITRFVTGLAKKVLIANTLGELGEIIALTNEKTILLYWMAAFAFMLQIYFDFSGYSDMAIGLGRMFGFHFMENFQYPFIAQSVTDFWRRWHISLSSWFRDYVYIPLGGNRAGKWIEMRNILVVWFLTGMWHGAAWNFIVWGLYFAVFLIIEKNFLLEKLKNRPPLLARGYTLLVVIISFVLFNANSLSVAGMNLQGMFGLLPVPLADALALYYLRSYAGVFLVACLASVPLPHPLIQASRRLPNSTGVMNALKPVYLTALLILITGYLIDGSFNPFLYFRF
jgi:alginate O-acetyltransferase complex protein AlgI